LGGSRLAEPVGSGRQPQAVHRGVPLPGPARRTPRNEPRSVGCESWTGFWLDDSWMANCCAGRRTPGAAWTRSRIQPRTACGHHRRRPGGHRPQPVHPAHVHRRAAVEHGCRSRAAPDLSGWDRSTGWSPAGNGARRATSARGGMLIVTSMCSRL